MIRVEKSTGQIRFNAPRGPFTLSFGPRQANLVLIAYASSEGSGEPAHPRSLARTSAARSYKQWVKRSLQTESQIPGPSEWLGMRSWNLSWRNARRHKFAWRGSFNCILWFLSFVFSCFDVNKGWFIWKPGTDLQNMFLARTPWRIICQYLLIQINHNMSIFRFSIIKSMCLILLVSGNSLNY